jgi:hypothetical protein
LSVLHSDKYIVHQLAILIGTAGRGNHAPATSEERPMRNAEIETRRQAAMSRGVGVMTQI